MSSHPNKRKRSTPRSNPLWPSTPAGQEYLLIRREIYDKVRLMLKPFGRNWDNPADDDLIRNDV